MHRAGGWAVSCLLLAGCVALALRAAADAPGGVAASSGAGATASAICVDVDGSPRNAYLECLSAQLAAQTQAAAEAQRAAMDTVVGNALPASPSAVGVYNQAATREVLGSAFGHGVRRPQVAPVYPNPNPLPPKR